MNRVEFDRKGPSGNIFWIMGAAMPCLTEEEGREMVAEVKGCHDYEAALAVIGKYVELVDTTDW